MDAAQRLGEARAYSDRLRSSVDTLAGQVEDGERGAPEPLAILLAALAVCAELRALGLAIEAGRGAP